MSAPRASTLKTCITVGCGTPSCLCTCQLRRDAKNCSNAGQSPAVLIVDLRQAAGQIGDRSRTVCMDSANGTVDRIFLKAKIEIAGVFALFVPEFRAILTATRYRLTFEVARGVAVFPRPWLAFRVSLGPSNGLHLEPHAAASWICTNFPCSDTQVRPPC